jgi:hypothetical protein
VSYLRRRGHALQVRAQVHDLSTTTKILPVIAAVDCTLVCVFKLSTSSITRLTNEFGIIESFGIRHVMEPIENILHAPKGGSTSNFQ